MTDTTTDHGVKPGDIFDEMWGYDQSNVEFYQVTRTTRTGVYLRQLATDYAQDGRHVVPIPDRFVEFSTQTWDGKTTCRIGAVNDRGEVFKRVNTGYHGRPWLNLTSYSGASPWEGRPLYDTIAAGDPGH